MERYWVLKDHLMGSGGLDPKGCPSRSPLVARVLGELERQDHPPTSHHIDSGNRCIQHWVGSSHQWEERTSLRGVVPEDAQDSHQRQRTDSSGASLEVLQPSSEGSGSEDQHGQSSDALLPEELHRKDARAGDSSKKDHDLLPQQQHHTGSILYPWRVQHHSGLPQQDDRSTRLDDQERDLPAHLSEMGDSNHRQICLPPQQCGSQIQLALLVPGNRSSELHGSPLEERAQLPVSPNQNAGINTTQVSDGRSRSNTDSSNLEVTTLVPNPSVLDNRLSHPNQPQEGSDARPFQQDGTMGQPQVEIRCISDFWQEALTGWSQEARRRVLSSFEGSSLNGKLERWINFCSLRNVNPLQSGELLTSTFADFLEHTLRYDTKGRVREKPIERPEGTLMAICTAINAAYSGAKLNSPAQDTLVVRMLQQIVQQETKRPKKDKGVIDIPKLLAFLMNSSDCGEEEKERLLLILVIGFVRIARLSDLFRLDRRTIKFSEDNEESRKVTIHSLGEKTDKSRRGHPVTLVRCSDPRVCPVRLLFAYLQRTQAQSECFLAQRPPRDRGPLPLFFYLNGVAKAIPQRAIEAEIKRLLSKAKMTEDAMGRKITPGCLRISARDAAEKAGFKEELISAIGHWSQHSTQARHYTPYSMPDDWTDKVLQPERL